MTRLRLKSEKGRSKIESVKEMPRVFEPCFLMEKQKFQFKKLCNLVVGKGVKFNNSE